MQNVEHITVYFVVNMWLIKEMTISQILTKFAVCRAHKMWDAVLMTISILDYLGKIFLDLVQCILITQESAIILAKLLLPQVFEKMEMQDLRALVAERSIMTLYISRESIEVPYHSIGILLEGFIKTQGIQEELITSPAALLPLHKYQSFQNLETTGNFYAHIS